MNLDEWKRALVNLEGATDAPEVADRNREWREAAERHRRGEISDEDYFIAVKQMSEGVRAVRSWGTAVFVVNDGRRYLLSARHVLHDAAKAHLRAKEILSRDSSCYPPGWQESELQSLNDTLFSVFFRVQRFGAHLNRNSDGHILMAVAAGGDSHSLSTLEYDLGVISLDTRYHRFADALENEGYEAVTLDDFADGPSGEGAEVCAIGFPVAVSEIGVVPMSEAEAHWSSTSTSAPVSSFGRVSMLHSDLFFFWADISIYGGNSGGPVIEGDKIVGVVSAQATIEIDDPSRPANLEPLRSRVPFGKIIKAKHARSLIEDRIRKEREWRLYPGR